MNLEIFRDELSPGVDVVSGWDVLVRLFARLLYGLETVKVVVLLHLHIVVYANVMETCRSHAYLAGNGRRVV